MRIPIGWTGDRLRSIEWESMQSWLREVCSGGVRKPLLGLEPDSGKLLALLGRLRQCGNDRSKILTSDRSIPMKYRIEYCTA